MSPSAVIEAITFAPLAMLLETRGIDNRLKFGKLSDSRAIAELERGGS